MPNQDGTGPQGKGPMTGRKLGKCGDESSNRGGNGNGIGRGRGRGDGLGLGAKSARGNRSNG